MKAILISINPKWVAKILNGEKTLEIRKSAPKDLPCEVYIYCTKENAKYFIDNKIYNAMMKGKVVAKFTLKKITPIGKDMFGYCPFTKEILDGEWLSKGSCLTQNDLRKYLGDKMGYAWHIDNLVIFDKPKELREFEKQGSYLNPSVKCRNKGTSRCNKGMSISNPHKWVGCNKARITKAPQSWCYVEAEE